QHRLTPGTQFEGHESVSSRGNPGGFSRPETSGDIGAGGATMIPWANPRSTPAPLRRPGACPGWHGAWRRGRRRLHGGESAGSIVRASVYAEREWEYARAWNS